MTDPLSAGGVHFNLVLAGAWLAQAQDRRFSWRDRAAATVAYHEAVANAIGWASR